MQRPWRKPSLGRGTKRLFDVNCSCVSGSNLSSTERARFAFWAAEKACRSPKALSGIGQRTEVLWCAIVASHELNDKERACQIGPFRQRIELSVPEQRGRISDSVSAITDHLPVLLYDFPVNVWLSGSKFVDCRLNWSIMMPARA